MYRTKVYEKLENQFLKPILDFVGLSIDASTECGLLKWVGCGRRDKETGKVIPKYFINQFNENKIYAIARTRDEFINFKSRKEELEFFNPFIKYKNALLLLLYTQPIVYERYCMNGDSDGDIADLVVNDEMEYTQEELYNRVRIKQYPVTKDEFDNPYYKYTYEMFCEDGSENEIMASSKVKIAAVIMTIIKVMGVLEESIDIVDEFNGDYLEVQTYLEDLLEKYVKERELNRKDMKKEKIDTEVETFTSDDLDLFENSSVEDLLVDADEDKEAKDEPEKVINVSNKYKNIVPISSEESDEDNRFMGLEFN